MITVQSGYVASGEVDSEPIQMEFSDGVHTIPEPIVAHLGGTQALKDRADLFKNKTYREFISGFWKLVEKVKLNEMGAAFLAGHSR